MKFSVLSVVAVLFIVLRPGADGKFPSNLKKCNRNDKDFNECLRGAVEDSLHLLATGETTSGLPKLNPFSVPQLVIGAGKAAVKIEQKYKEWSTYGFDHIEIRKADMDFDNKQFSMDFYSPQMDLKADYEANGNLLVLPVKGHGRSRISMYKLKGRIELPFEVKEKDGKHFMEFTECQLKFDPDFIELDYENLFDGNAELSKNLNQTLNENWKDVFADMQVSFENAYCQAFRATANRFFGKNSIEEVFE